ncbi:hypothetical protein BDW02DRAFT_652134 [Decorospora gaudefroyi]|uniref:Integrase catalytic domain-containing protein n=1 Tax=Decorospora gaudefroyi TaxID=184978 RepID=A0A6A5JXJ9_9PLEO|nr:hypothetical protein BDW02DRAFT_652134 [Decorospora gaudefroyi]
MIQQQPPSSTATPPPPTPLSDPAPLPQPPVAPPSPDERTRAYDLSKLYTDDHKFSGDRYDVLNLKLTIFYELCGKVGIEPDRYKMAFSTMLRGKALTYYYQYISPHNYTFDGMTQKLREYFHTAENNQLFLNEWRTLMLKDIITANPDKDLAQCLEIAVASELRNAVGTWMRCHPTHQFNSFDDQQDHAFYTNRRYNRSDNSRQDGYRPHRFGGSAQQGSPHDRPNYPDRRPLRTPTHSKKCFVCGKQGCWSTRHSIEERRASQRRFRTYAQTRDVNPDYAVFLAEFEGIDLKDDTSSEDDTTNDLDTFYTGQHEQFFTSSCGDVNGQTITTNLNNTAMTHAITGIDPYANEPAKEETHLFTFDSRYSAHLFQGIMPDTGAAGVSTAGKTQVTALQRIQPSAIIDTSTAGRYRIRFGDNPECVSIGDVNVNTPFGTMHFAVMPTNTPFLLCLADMDRHGIYLNNVDNVLVHQDKEYPVIRKWGHPWLLLNSYDTAAHYLTESELRQLHRRFGHPAADRLHKILTKAGHDNVHKDIIDRINKFCHQCQLYSKAPGRFRFTIRDDIDFNFRLIVDVMYIHQKPVLHAVDEATAFQAARFLLNLQANTTWNTLRAMWIDMYVGPPDIIATDAGKNFISEEFVNNAKTMAINVEEVPVEAHQSIGKVERYHAAIRRAFDVISADIGNAVTPEHTLQMAVKAVNDTAGPDGLIPTLLVFGKVKVWRENRGWTGPHTLLAFNPDYTAATVDVNGHHATFRITSVKPYHSDNSTFVPPDHLDDGEDDADDDDFTPNLDQAQPKRGRGRPKGSKNKPKATTAPTEDVNQMHLAQREQDDLLLSKKLRAIGKITTPGRPFEQSAKAEIDALITRVIQGYADDGKKIVLTQSPTIQRASQRIIIALAPSLLREGLCLWLRDITQAYTQSNDPLQRTIIANLLAQLRDSYPDGTIMVVVKPLYGIAEAGAYWWSTYFKHHTEKLHMQTSTYDPCLLVSKPLSAGFGIVGMQTDDTLGLSDQDFANNETKELCFKAKDKQFLAPSNPIDFNGCVVSIKHGTITLRQKRQGEKLEPAKDKKSYIQQRARGAYIATICQPEASFDLAAAAQATNPSKEEISRLNKRLTWQKDNVDRGLRYVQLDMKNLKLFTLVDALFANNKDMSSQMGYVIILGNELMSNEGSFRIRGNIVHWSSIKCKRITRSVLASEIYAMAHGVDIAIAIGGTIDLIMERLLLSKILIVVCTDSRSLYDCLVKLGTTKEKRLMIDIMALREAYERSELMDIRWIDGRDNPADSMIKANANASME